MFILDSIKRMLRQQNFNVHKIILLKTLHIYSAI